MADVDFFEAAGLGMQTSNVRQNNLRAILTLTALNPGITAAELSRRSTLAPQTVSSVIDDLTKAGLIRQGEVLRGRRGQPATPQFVNATGAYSIGFELGWRHLQAVLVDIGGGVHGEYRRDYAFPDPRSIFNEIAAVTKQLVGKIPEADRSKILCVGLAAPSGIGRNVNLLEADAQVVKLWQTTDLALQIEKATGFKTQVFNDGNAACWAELSAYPAPRPSNFTYILISTFMAAGIVANGMLWEGPTGNSANLGSMMVTDSRGKQTFVHLLATIYALEQRLKAAGISVPATTPMFWPWDDWQTEVDAWIAEAAPALAKAILNSAAVIEVNTVIVDGVMPSHVLDRFIAAVVAAMQKLPVLTFDRPALTKGHAGGAAPSRGAAYLPLYRRFFSRDLSNA